MFDRFHLSLTIRTFGKKGMLSEKIGSDDFSAPKTCWLPNLRIRPPTRGCTERIEELD